MRTPSSSGSVGFVVVFLVLFQGLDGRYAKNDEVRIRDYLLSHVNYSVRGRPVLDSQETVVVAINLMPYALIYLNERDQMITISAWISMIWTDPRLSWNETEFGGESTVKVFIDEIWTPRVFITNVLDLDSLILVTQERGSIIVHSSGGVELGVPMVLSTQCHIIVEHFPFDVQGCPFWFYAENEDASRLFLYPYMAPEFSEIVSREWDLTNVTSNWFLIPNDGSTNLSASVFCMTFRRNPLHYIWNLVVPSTCLCLMSFTTFMSPPDSGERIALAISTVLGLTVFQLQVANLLPTDSRTYPHLTMYLSMNFILACVTVPLSLLNINIAYGDSRAVGLGHPAGRRVLLELLPRVFWIPTYSERIKEHAEGVAIPDKETWEEGNHEAWANQIESEMALPVSHLENHVHPQTPETGNERVTGGISQAEKTKVERRIVALVMDKIYVILFAIAFLGISAMTIVNLERNGELPPTHECVRYMTSNYYVE